MFLDPLVAAEFSARFDPSGPLGFIEEALEFVAEWSEFLTHVGVERDVAAVLRAVREKQKQKQKLRYLSKIRAKGMVATVAKIWRYVTSTKGFIPSSMTSFDLMVIPAKPT
ncbi:hypothetical protein NL676_023133 [Syzygium grande]|nr:hypothetical protein NL676_023133 [Syzygium grande]